MQLSGQQPYDPGAVNILSYCQTLGAQNPRIVHRQEQDGSRLRWQNVSDAAPRQGCGITSGTPAARR